MRSQPFERNLELPPGVTHRNRDIAQKSGIPRPLDRSAAKHLSELVLPERRHALQRRSEIARREGGISGVGSTAVPWTHVLANVASKDLSPCSDGMLGGGCPTQLDREIRNAAACVQLPRSERVGR